MDGILTLFVVLSFLTQYDCSLQQSQDSDYRIAPRSASSTVIVACNFEDDDAQVCKDAIPAQGTFYCFQAPPVFQPLKVLNLISHGTVGDPLFGYYYINERYGGLGSAFRKNPYKLDLSASISAGSAIVAMKVRLTRNTVDEAKLVKKIKLILRFNGIWNKNQEFVPEKCTSGSRSRLSSVIGCQLGEGTIPAPLADYSYQFKGFLKFRIVIVAIPNISNGDPAQFDPVKVNSVTLSSVTS